MEQIFTFPSAIVNGCVNIISGEYIETSLDFSIPGARPLEVQRFYCGAGCKKQSLLYGWQLNHGAKLLTYHTGDVDHAIVVGGDRHGVQFTKTFGSLSYNCPKSFFDKHITNCSFGEINATNNFKNDCVLIKHKDLELQKADKSKYLFVKSSHDPARISSTHGYRLEKHAFADGTFYEYEYSNSFGMPTAISQLNRDGGKIGEVN